MKSVRSKTGKDVAAVHDQMRRYVYCTAKRRSQEAGSEVLHFPKKLNGILSLTYCICLIIGVEISFGCVYRVVWSPGPSQ